MVELDFFIVFLARILTETSNSPLIADAASENPIAFTLVQAHNLQDFEATPRDGRYGC
jgi:hypothetical protein